MEDMLGLSPRVPRFVKKFGKVGEVIEGAIRDYAADVRSRAFPTPEHTYAMKGAAKSGRRTGPAEVKATKKPKTPSSKG
jgi:3-methyl-2-oxobutanoate hydroxymethyltransferase